VRSAAARQNGLAPLLADVAAAADGDLLPEPVRQAATELLALRVPLRSDLTASDVKQAFARSGLLLEAKLAAVSDGAPAEAAPDLKAALGVFRQALRAWLDTASPGAKPAASPVLGQGALPAPDEAVAPQLAATPVRVPGVPAQSTGPMPSSPAAPPGAPAAPGPLAAPPDVPGEMATQQNPQRDAAATGRASLATLIDASTLQRGALPAAASAILLATAEAQAALPRKAGLNAGKGLSPTVPAEPETQAMPPPPHRGAPPAPQPAVPPSLMLLADPRAVGETLLVETEAALARQTLLQAASLPDRAESPSQRPETSGPRWNFEVPFATPNGTAIAQFEIGRDGHAAPGEASPHAWRVRFTLDVEPMGPVHAHIALAGPRASVSLWAERGTSAAQLREHAALLREALAEAEFEPGEVVVREGAPPHTLAAAGRFLDRES
jgi:Flagellar hook-length control protein FliK